jgi:uncharacterized RDD family membrane protein YckC
VRWGLARRYGARTIDLCVVLFPAVVLGFVFGRAVAPMVMRQGLVRTGVRTAFRVDRFVEDLGNALIATVLVPFLLVMVFLCCYDWFFHAVFGRTPGKWIFRLRVVRTGRGGDPGAWRSLIRTVIAFGGPTAVFSILLVYLGAGGPTVALVVNLLFGGSLLGLLMILGPARRTLHDRLSGTEVAPA